MKILQLILCICIVARKEVFALMSDRIIAGRNCSSQEYPYLATIKSNNLICGGSFVTPGWVLTVAHCCTLMTPISEFIVVGGQTHMLLDDQERSPIEAVFPHKQFIDNAVRKTFDICLVKLRNPVTPSTRIKITKLVTTAADYEGLIRNGKCNEALIMGFGEQKPGVRIPNLTLPNNIFEDHVKCVNMAVLPRSECNERTDFSETIGDDIFCMQHPVHKYRDACIGDSGGPVYCGNLQIGLVTSGGPCGHPELPSFYTRVDPYKDFIERHIQMELGKSLAAHSNELFHILMIFAIIIVAIFNTNILNR